MLAYEFMNELAAEWQRAKEKFPGQTDKYVTTLALMEEVGEMAQAILKCDHEGRKKTPEDVRAEAVQVAVMAARLAVECDLG